MRKAIGQFAVVGDQDQSFAVQIEPADSEQPDILVGHQIDHAGPAAGVAIGRHHPFGLIDGIIDPASERQRLAIDADILGGRIDPRAELGHHFAVHLDAAGGNQAPRTAGGFPARPRPGPFAGARPAGARRQGAGCGRGPRAACLPIRDLGGRRPGPVPAGRDFGRRRLGLRRACGGNLATLETDDAARPLAFGRPMGRLAGRCGFLGGEFSSWRAGHRLRQEQRVERNWARSTIILRPHRLRQGTGHALTTLRLFAGG